MAGEYQFGIDDAKVTRREAGGDLAATKVDVLGVSSISFGIESDSVEHRGDNETKRIRKTGKKVTGSVEQAATNLPTYAVVGDGVVTTSGTTPDTVTTYTEPASSAGGTYQIEAQAADIDGSTRFTVFNATTTGGPNFEWSEGEFSNPSWDYEGSGFTPSESGAVSSLFKIDQYETEEPIE